MKRSLALPLEHDFVYGTADPGTVLVKRQVQVGPFVAWLVIGTYLAATMAFSTLTGSLGTQGT